MTENLFVGGQMDGRRVAMPLLLRLCVFPPGEDAQPENAPPTNRREDEGRRYKLTCVADDKGLQHIIYALDGMTGHEMLRRLVAGYKGTTP